MVIDYIDENEFYEIINIDHHHDLGYLPTVNENNTKIDCANWMAALYDKRIINKYTWLNNFNSNSNTIKSEYPTDIKLLTTYDLSQLNPDKIIICLSPDWIPPKYRELFFVWMDIMNTIYNTHFDFN